MRAAAYAFQAHPAAVEDLRHLPCRVREETLELLERLVHAQVRGPELDLHGRRDLRGCRKLYVGTDSRWRAVYIERPAPGDTGCRREIYLLAVGLRDGCAAYNKAHIRMPGPACAELPGPGPADRGSSCPQ